MSALDASTARRTKYARKDADIACQLWERDQGLPAPLWRGAEFKCPWSDAGSLIRAWTASVKSLTQTIAVRRT